MRGPIRARLTVAVATTAVAAAWMLPAAVASPDVDAEPAGRAVAGFSAPRASSFGEPPGDVPGAVEASGEAEASAVSLAKNDATAFAAANGGLWSLQVPADAGGELRTVPGTHAAPHEAQRVLNVEVIVEEGLGVDGPAFAAFAMAVLNDPRGWGHDGSVVFERSGSEDADVRLYLASPATTDELCAPLPTNGRLSCGRVGFAALNAERWAIGAEPFLDGGGTVEEYRAYLVNHEVGHVIGYGHVRCPEPGTLAPVMLQQSLWLDGCEPNGWPNPDG